MANIIFDYEATHRLIRNVNGYVTIQPALPNRSRLYVIFNDSTNRTVYVGTAESVQDRFKDRIDAVQHLGFSQSQLDAIFIAVIHITFDGKNTPPHDDGKAQGVDVEHLLIRTYITPLGCLVRNTLKTEQFLNKSGQTLTWELKNSAGIANFGGPYNYKLPPNTLL